MSSSANVDILLGMFPNLPKEKALIFLAKANHNLEGAIDQALEYTVQSESQIAPPVKQPPLPSEPPRTPVRPPPSPLTSSVTPEARAANAAFNHALEQKLTKIRMNANPSQQILALEAVIREQGEQVNVLNLGADLMRRELLEEREKIRSTTADLKDKEQQLAQEKANANAINTALTQQRERFLSQSKHLEDELAKANRLLEEQMTKSQIHRFEPQVEAQRDQRMAEMKATLQAEIATLTEQRDSQVRDLASRDAAMKTLQTILQKQNIEILHLREEAVNSKKLIANLETQIEDAKEATVLPVAELEPAVVLDVSAEIPLNQSQENRDAQGRQAAEAVAAAAEQAAALEKKVQALEEELDQSTSAINALTKQVDSLQVELSEKTIEIENLRSQLTVARDNEDELLSKNLQLQDQLEDAGNPSELKARVAALTSQLNERTSQVEKLTEKLSELDSLNEVNKEFKEYALELEKELRKLREQHASAADDFKEQIEAKERERLALLERIEQFQQLQGYEASSTSQLRAQLEAQAQELKATKRELEAVQVLAQAETESLKSIASETLSDSGLLSFSNLLRTSQEMVRSSQEILKLDVLQSSQEIHEEKMSFIQEIEKQKQALKTTIAQLQTDLASCAQDIEDELAFTAAKASQLEKENESLKDQVDELESVQAQLDESRLELSQLRSQVQTQESESGSLIASLQAQVREQQDRLAASEQQQKEAVRTAVENFTQSLMQDYSQMILSRSQTYMN